MRPKIRRKGCSCRKYLYASKLDALIAMSNIHAKDNRPYGHVERRAYRCPEQLGWHLTSQER